MTTGRGSSMMGAQRRMSGCCCTRQVSSGGEGWGGVLPRREELEECEGNPQSEGRRAWFA